MNDFVKQLKEQILDEFNRQDRRGVYAFTQKIMAYNSNKIEGSTLTSEQTALLFDTGTIISDGEFVYRAKDVEEMTGHFKMFNEVLKNLGKPLTADMIKSFHFQLKTGVFEDYANGYPVGEFKNRANAVGNKTELVAVAAKSQTGRLRPEATGNIITEMPRNVPSRIEELISAYNAGERNLGDIARFHLEYERIHPFQDGNGRTGRAIIFKQCLDSGIVPAIIRDEDKARYYHALQTAQEESLIAFLKEEQNKYYEQIKAFVEVDAPTKQQKKTSKQIGYDD